MLRAAVRQHTQARWAREGADKAALAARLVSVHPLTAAGLGVGSVALLWTLARSIFTSDRPPHTEHPIHTTPSTGNGPEVPPSPGGERNMEPKRDDAEGNEVESAERKSHEAEGNFNDDSGSEGEQAANDVQEAQRKCRCSGGSYS